jgi:CMP-N,N'-diacetyllegionaminic acid synthase
MINEKKVLAIIPARGGSKGVPGKNIKLLSGKPLIAWTITEAKKSKFIDRTIVTTDDDKIIKVSKEWGAEVPFKRPEHLSQDDTPGIEPVLHAMDYFKDYEYIVLLQPTSPLRTVEDIDQSIRMCITNDKDSCVSFTESNSTPYWMYHISSDGKLKQVIDQKNIPYQRQKAEKVYELNGAIYVCSAGLLKRSRSFIHEDTLPYIMPQERSVDIDTMEDFHFCEYLVNKLKG